MACRLDNELQMGNRIRARRKKRSPHDKFVKEKYTDKKHGLPDDCCVAVFHGKPNPAEIQHDPLVLDNWR